MRNNQPVTQREIKFDSDTRLISTTDLKGRIVHANDDFCRVAGFTAEELSNQPHNIIRHPDMPAAVFQNFWDTLKAGKPWMGIVKNRSKNGDHYWVDAYVAPVFDGGTLVGYQSVRTAPDRAHVRRAEALYTRMRRQAGRMPRNLLPGLQGRTALVMVLLVIVATTAGTLTGPGWPALFVGGALALTAWPLSLLLCRRLARVAARARQLFDNPVGRQVYGNGGDECAALELALHMKDAQLRTLRGRIGDFTGRLVDESKAVEGSAAQAGRAIDAQRSDVDQVAVAMNQMTSTVAEVSRNTSHAAEEAREAVQRARQGKTVIDQAAGSMEALAGETQSAADVIQRLQAEAEGIRGILDTISGIAEQTNLLALNAAIEAARAGDTGRGFAVVADEVRNLSRRTAEATTEIGELISRLTDGTEEAARVMTRGQQASQQVAGLSRQVREAMESLEASVDNMNDRNSEIATASEEQNAVSEEINRNLSGVQQQLASTSDAAEQARTASQALGRMIRELEGLVAQMG